MLMLPELLVYTTPPDTWESSRWGAAGTSADLSRDWSAAGWAGEGRGRWLSLTGGESCDSGCLGNGGDVRAAHGMCEPGPNLPTEPSRAKPGLGRCGARWRTRPTRAGFPEQTTVLTLAPRKSSKSRRSCPWRCSARSKCWWRLSS